MNRASGGPRRCAVGHEEVNALGSPRPPHARSSRSPSARPALALDQDGDPLRRRQGLRSYDYTDAGLFTRFLVDRHGAVRFRDYFRVMGALHDPTPPEFEQEFEAAFGETLDAAWSVFVAEPRCKYDFWYCGRQTPVELPLELDGIDCASSETLGFSAPEVDPLRNPYRPMRILHWHSDAARSVEIHIENATVELASCGDCTQQTRAFDLDETNDPFLPYFPLDLDSGTYALIVRQKGEGHVRVSMRLR